MALMISVSGIRGIFGSDLTPENLTKFTAAYGSWANGTVVVGRDSRVTGAICEDIVCATLRSVGCDVVTVGVAPTPTIAMGVLKHKAAGGIIISASHNPAEWNALKLLNGASEFLSATSGEKIIQIAENETYEYQDYRHIGSLTKDETLLDHHIDEILNLPYIDTDLIRANNFSVAVDPVNGAGCVALPQLLKRLGVEIIHSINDEPNGLFAHNPEPLPAHLEDLCSLVTQKECDLGLAVDPDADRLAIVDQHGDLWGEEYTQAAAFDFMLSHTKGPIATNLSSSRVAEDVAERHGVTCHRSAVGEINVVEKMKAVDAVIGGEGNGGVINPDLHPGRDSLVGTAMILQLLAEREQTASEYRASLPDYAIVKSKFQLEGVDADAMLAAAEKAFSDEKITTIDGVKIDFEQGWVHLRKSNTEPILRIYSEAKSEKAARSLAKNVLETIQ